MNKNKLDKKTYAKALDKLQVQLCEMHQWLQHHKKRLVVIFEGRDTAGKGGAINCFTEVLNPRYCRVAALPRPSEREQTQWYFQRYLAHLPAAGEITLFDRSWYNRAGVEKVMGFCTDAEYHAFLRDCPKLERMLVADGILLYKYWFGVDQALQERRFAERAQDPVKRWKISPIDLAAREKYDEYGRARDAMLKATHTKEAPWYLLDANDQRRARLNLLRHLVNHLPREKIPVRDIALPALKRKRPGKEKFSAYANRVPEIY